MDFTAKDVAKLREVTGAGFADCKSALTDAKTFDEAVKLIEAKGQKRAEKVKNADRETSEGLITSYIHHAGNLGVLLELNCSTDFVARSDEFKNLARELTLQIAGAHPAPVYANVSDIPAETLATIRAEIEADPEVKKRPEKVRAQVVEGKIKKRMSTDVLMEQIWIKDDKMTIGKLVDDVIRKTGENIVVRRFARFELGA